MIIFPANYCFGEADAVRKDVFSSNTSIKTPRHSYILTIYSYIKVTTFCVQFSFSPNAKYFKILMAIFSEFSHRGGRQSDKRCFQYRHVSFNSKLHNILTIQFFLKVMLFYVDHKYSLNAKCYKKYFSNKGGVSIRPIS